MGEMFIRRIMNSIRRRNSEEKDIRLMVIAFAGFVGAIALISVLSWAYWKYDTRLQYGDPAGWPTHNNRYDNFTFSYPSQMDIIVPEDDTKNPTSIVKKGERGESVLIQLGTWRADPPLTSLENAVGRYEFGKRNMTEANSREQLEIDGRRGALVAQEETGGRYVIDTFLWDGRWAREISLQLPKGTSPEDREFYEEVYRAILNSIMFNYDNPDINH